MNQGKLQDLPIYFRSMSENWKQVFFDKGEIKPRGRFTVVYTASKPLSVQSVKANCSCTTPKWDPVKGTLTVGYKGGTIPVHLTERLVRQYIKITYTDGTFDTVGFKAVIK